MIDIRTFCQQNGLPMMESGHHHCRKGWVQTHCPRCAGGGSGWHLGFNLARGNFRCWRCGAIPFVQAIQELLHCDEQSAKAAIAAAQADGGTSPHTPPPLARQPVARTRGSVPPPHKLSGLAYVHHVYLERRGFDADKLARDWDLKCTGHTGDNWGWRIVYPVRGPNSRVVAWQGRAISDGNTPKYKLSDDADCGEPKTSMLYGIERTVHDSPVLLVEGVTGVWRFGPGTIASLGVDWSPGQMNRLREFTRRFILFDPEPLAQKRARVLAQTLSLYDGETEVLSGFTCDPGDMTDGQAAEVRREIGL